MHTPHVEGGGTCHMLAGLWTVVLVQWEQCLMPACGSRGGEGSAWGMPVGVLAVVMPTCVCGVHVGASCSLRVCVQGREPCGGPAPPLCAPAVAPCLWQAQASSQCTLSGHSPASAGCLCEAKPDPAPEPDLRCPGIKHEAPAHTCGLASEAGLCRVAVPTTVRVTLLCLLLAGSRTLL